MLVTYRYRRCFFICTYLSFLAVCFCLYDE